MITAITILGLFLLMNTNFQNNWYGVRACEPPSFGRALIVDDNDFYAERVASWLGARGAHTERVASAAAAMRLLARQGAKFDLVVTDISMETELAGLKVLRYVRCCGFEGRVATSTTGLDSWWGFGINRIVLGVFYRSDYLIPKKPIADHDRLLWLQMRP